MMKCARPGAPFGVITSFLPTGWPARPPSASRKSAVRPSAHFTVSASRLRFTGEDAGSERLIPFDLVPRIIPADEWAKLERRLKQRVAALNAFLHDIYHDQKILDDGRVPRERVLGNAQYRREMQGIDVPGGIYAHVAGIDLVRTRQGEWYVLEDNLRELLILRADMPRSLHSCMNFIHETLQALSGSHSGELNRQSGQLHAQLHYGRADDIIEFGLHEYLMDFLKQISGLGGKISRVFLAPLD